MAEEQLEWCLRLLLLQLVLLLPLLWAIKRQAGQPHS